MTSEPSSSHSLSGADLNFKVILSVLLKKIKFIGIMTAVFTLFGVCYVFFAQPMYRSEAIIEISSDKTAALGGKMAQSLMGLNSKTRTPYEIVILSSTNVLERVVNELKLHIHVTPTLCPILGKRFFYTTLPGQLRAPVWGMKSYMWGGETIKFTTFEVPTEYLNKEFTVQKINDTEFGIDYCGDKTYEAVNSIGTLGTELVITTSKGKITVNISQFIAHTGSVFKVQCEKKHAVIEEMRANLEVKESKKGLDLLSIAYNSPKAPHTKEVVTHLLNAYIKRGSEFQNQELEQMIHYINSYMPALQKKLNECGDEFNDFRRKNKSIDLEKQVTGELTHFDAIKTRISELYQKKAEMLQRFTNQHLSVKSIDHQIQYLEEDLKKNEYKVLNLPDLQNQFLKLELNVRIQTELYTDLLKKNQELEILKAGNSANVRIIEYPEIPEFSIKPQKSLVLLIFIAFGLIVGCGIILAHHFFYGFIQGVGTLSLFPDIPVIASILRSVYLKKSFDKAELNQTNQIISVTKPDDISVEGMRSLRTHLHFSKNDMRNNLIMVTSATGGVGKTFISINLAVLLAQSQKKVLLIDCDLRKGTIHNYFNSIRSKGLSNYFIDEDTDIIQSTPIPGLDLVVKGDYILNQNDHFMGRQFDLFFETCISNYDTVIIDTPPVLPVSDAMIIGRKCSHILFVVRDAYTTISDVNASLKLLHQAHVSPSGFILNDLCINTENYLYYTSRYVYSDKNEKKSVFQRIVSYLRND